MTTLFSVITLICLVLFQTSVAPGFWGGGGYLDLVVIYVVYLSIFRPLRESIVFIILSGILMDSMSGGPFGLYLTVYFWVFVGIWLTKNYLHVGAIVLLPLITGGSVFIQNAVTVAVMAFAYSDFKLVPENFRSIMVQLLAAGLAGPFIIIFLRNIQDKLDSRSFEKVFKYGR